MCNTDLGAPNVKEASTDNEIDALRARVEHCEKEIAAKKLQFVWNDFHAYLASSSGVVVTMPASIARGLAFDPRQLYVTYGILVEGSRTPAPPPNDRQRVAVEGTIFGSYGPDIRYGVLAVEHDGLPSYGHVACRLRADAIRDRTSFLEMNSFDFVDVHALGQKDPIPPGHRSNWARRHDLAMVKLARLLAAGQTRANLRKLLVKAHAKDRHKDDFVEAHIFGPFTIRSVESMVPLSAADASEHVRLDTEIALELFKKVPRSRTSTASA